MLLKVYANRIDGEQDAVNQRISEALGERGTLTSAAADNDRPEPACGPSADQSKKDCDGNR